MIAAVEFFGLTSLEVEIQKTIEDILKDENLFPIVFHGDCDHPLRQLAWTRLLQRIHPLSQNGEFVALELSEICQIVQADGLALPTEYHVFKMAHTWLNADRPTRSVHLSRLMGCVRFHYMTPRELAKCQNKESMFASCKPAADMVALAYIARPFILENDEEFLQRFDLPPPRNLDILRHFTSFKQDTDNSVYTESVIRPAYTASIHHKLYTEGDTRLFPCPPVSRAPPTGTPIRKLPRTFFGFSGEPDVSTMAGVGELPEDHRPDAVKEDTPPLPIRPLTTVKEEVPEPAPPPEERSPSVKSVKSAHSKDSSKSGRSAMSAFCQMTFNQNGSLVTKRGGREAHRTLTKAFERIYEVKMANGRKEMEV